MKKNFLVLIFCIALGINTNAQTSFKQIEGTWIVDSIIKLKDNSKTFGKYANIGEFLKFVFKDKSYLSTSKSPFDDGYKIEFKLKNNNVEIVSLVSSFNNYNTKSIKVDLPLISESAYRISSLTEKALKLKTFDKNKDSIMYCLSRPLTLSGDSLAFNFPEFIIREKIGTNTNVIYNFKMGRFRGVTPVYNSGSSLGVDLGLKLNLLKFFNIGVISDQLVIKIKINNTGVVENVTIIKGLNEKIDKKVTDFFSKTKWTPIIGVSKVTMNFTMRFFVEDIPPY